MVIWHVAEKLRCCSIAGFVSNFVTCTNSWPRVPSTRLHLPLHTAPRPLRCSHTTSQPHSGQKRLSPLVLRLGHLPAEALSPPLWATAPGACCCGQAPCCTSPPLSLCFSAALQMDCGITLAYSKGAFKHYFWAGSSGSIQDSVFPTLSYYFYFLKVIL